MADNMMIINGREAFPMDLATVGKGVVKPGGKKEIVNYYNLSEQKHHNFLIIDLETGQRGYYPGKDSE